MTPGMTPKGEKMPQTPEEFQYMVDLHENALIKADEENARLRAKVNRLEQKIDQLRRRNA